MFRSRFGKILVVIGLGIVAGVLLRIPHGRRMPRLIGPLSLWFNESLEGDREILHDKRRYIFQETCKRLNSSYADKQNFDFDPKKFYNIYVNDEYKFLYCSVPKVACTNWKRALLSLLGIEKPDDITHHDIYDHDGKYFDTLKSMKLSTYTREGALEKLRTYQKFIFVREPFERILSVWKNKFDSNIVYFQKRWGTYIVKRYRENPTREALTEGNDVTFQEFLRFLIDPQTEKDGMHNDHWRSYESLCYPCIVNYDYIGKYSDMDTDIAYITKKLKIERMKLSDRSLRYSHAPTSTIVDEHYAKISLREIQGIYETYKSDFAVFNYPYKTFDKFDPHPPEPAVVV